jgi:hypothetical protein
MMTRKDYVKTADILVSYASEMSRDLLEDLVFDFSEMFSEDNPNFDETKFYNAIFNNDNEIE